MPKEARQDKLIAAYKMLRSATEEEKRELFQDNIQIIESSLAKLKEKEDPFYTYGDYTAHACDEVMTLLFRLTSIRGYEVLQEYEKYNSNAGRSTKYSTDDRIFHCSFIDLMVNRGSSPAQAMKLLMKLKGEDKVAPQGFIKELQETYRAHEKSEGFKQYREKDIFDNANSIAKMLEFNFKELPTSNEKAFDKAINAFRKLWEETITLMKEYHNTIAEKDSCYPQMFGCTIDWVKSDFKDPIDYFYKHKSHNEVDIHNRKRFLTEYLNTVGFFKYG